MTDKKVLHIISASTLAALLIIFFIPFDTVGRVLAAFALAVAAAASYIFIKKRSILSMNKKQVTMIITAIAFVYLMLYYLSGIKLGFFKNPYALNGSVFFTRFLPTVAVIVASEIMRYILRAQEDKTADLLSYLSCVVGEMIVCSTASVAISSFNNFMDLVALTMFPAIIANLLYHYLSKRYGFYPNMIYRLITSLYIYIIPVKPNVSNSLMAFITLMMPLIIFLFVDSLYERKIRYALEKKSKLAIPITVIAVAIMIFVVLVVSNQFVIGSYVIATESMTGELNKGDAAIYERYEDQTVAEGQVIAFEKDDIVVIHRVVDIQIINGQTRYFTKGDTNDSNDSGFIFDSNIIGLVKFKIPFIGYPTLWLRSLFSR